MTDCLLVTANAEDFAAEIRRLADSQISNSVCASPDQALNE